jgi:phospholipase D1/2
MRRPPYYSQEWRLDQILKRRAEAGVNIFVIIYREVEAAITCNSLHTKHALQALCPKGSKGYGNITVMRHPDHNVFENAADMTFYWAHHEKFIVIDWNLAFIGGLDLCFGRWDHHAHPLSDVHPAGVIGEIWPGQDFNNNRVMDFKNVQHWKDNELSKAEYGRMPWHDVAIGVVGDCVYDIAEHFILRWNFIKRDKYKRDEEFDWLITPGRSVEDEDLTGAQRPEHPVGNYITHPLSPIETKALGKQGTVHAQVVRSSCDWSSGILPEHSIQNAYIDIIRNAEHYVYVENQFFITATGDEQAPIHNKIGRAIVDAVVRAGKEGKNFKVIAVIPAVPGFAGDLRGNAAKGTRAIMDYQYKSILRGEHSIFEQIRAQGVDPTKYIFFFNLRSYDRLNVSPAIKKQEEESGVTYQEVQRAQAHEIMSEGIDGSKGEQRVDEKKFRRKKSKEILDQDSGDEVEEEKTDAKRKFEAKRHDESDSQHPLSSDSVAKSAMLNQPSLADESWQGSEQDEINLWVQEELYIHGKVLIVDDKTVICGSSNINDRSQLGIHDSELSIVMTDTKTLPSKMAGKEYEAGYHAATLRRYLWREHLGLLHPQDLDASKDINAQPPEDGLNDPHEGETYEFVADPLSDEVWEMWTSRATRNTEVFEKLFHADPANCSKSMNLAISYRLSLTVWLINSQQLKTLKTMTSTYPRKARNPATYTTKTCQHRKSGRS